MFIADLHLQAAQPECLNLAIRFLDEVAAKCPQLFILGDLVEYWIGDDADDGTLDSFFKRLAARPERGYSTFFMHGNRDFLIGDAFADRCNLALLKQDTYLYEDLDIRLLLMHGDTLCTDDQDYQHMRATFRDVDWQQAFLAKSISERRDYAQALRAQSRSRSADKPSDITDVNEATVVEVMEQAGVSQLLHGHTHRPRCHDITTRAGSAQRWVLGDWHADHAVYAVLDRGVITLETFR